MCHLWQEVYRKQIEMSTCRYTLPLYALLVQNVEKNFTGGPVSPNIPLVNTPNTFPPSAH